LACKQALQTEQENRFSLISLQLSQRDTIMFLIESVKQAELLTVSIERDDRCLLAIYPAKLKSRSLFTL